MNFRVTISLEREAEDSIGGVSTCTRRFAFIVIERVQVESDSVLCSSYFLFLVFNLESSCDWIPHSHKIRFDIIERSG